MTTESDSSPATSPSHPRWRRLRGAVVLMLIVGSLVGLLMRFTVRDSIQPLAPFFYALPRAVTAAFAVLAWLLMRRSDFGGRRFVAVLAILQCVLLAASWNRPAEAPASNQPIRLGFWNISSGMLGKEAITETVKAWDADVIGLAEAVFNDGDKNGDRAHAYWKEAFPQYHVVKFPASMMLFSRVPLTVVDEGSLAEGSSYGVASFEQNGQTTYLVMADLLSKPHHDRGPSFESLTRIIRELPPGPVIIMGDMNTPPSSVHFDDLRETTRNAFEEQGHGFYHSWPIPLPVLALDQVWVNAEVDVLDCRLAWTIRSDHRPVLTTLQLRE